MTSSTRRGLGLAAGLLLGWLGSWALLLPTTLGQLPLTLVGGAVVLRTLLQTGLFIVAHDAMHSTLWPDRPEVNRRIGQLALLLYAALPYERCRRNHVLHHRHAGTQRDPDHHPDGQPAAWRWYGRFMAAYLSPGQLTGLVLGWLVLAALGSQVSASPVLNVLLYGALPTLLSSLQLFVVGTYLPHRGAVLHRGAEETPGHEPRSLAWPCWLSLLSCYHFGYHWEHHAYPHLAWHELPAARRPAPVRA
ncbi:MAG: fatty acid desaturase [Cyanobacteriota bacterium]|nr:fatty acid desaturase [Cyanobacteriota bacterium]